MECSNQNVCMLSVSSAGLLLVHDCFITLTRYKNNTGSHNVIINSALMTRGIVKVIEKHIFITGIIRTPNRGPHRLVMTTKWTKSLPAECYYTNDINVFTVLCKSGFRRCWLTTAESRKLSILFLSLQ